MRRPGLDAAVDERPRRGYQGVAYYDTTAVNRENAYRPDVDVDLRTNVSTGVTDIKSYSFFNPRFVVIHQYRRSFVPRFRQLTAASSGPVTGSINQKRGRDSPTRMLRNPYRCGSDPIRA